MTDYGQPKYVEKRLRYFSGQFLKAQDFVDEQKYHLNRQRWLGRLLRVSGIAEGLTVSSTVDNGVTVQHGVALDSEGRLIVLRDERQVQNITSSGKLVIRYTRVESDRTPETDETGGELGYTRFHEQPTVEVITSGDPSDPDVLLAHLDVDGSSVTVNSSVRVHTGLCLPWQENGTGPILRAGGADRADLTGSLTVSGNVGIGTTEPNHRLTIDCTGDTNHNARMEIRTRADCAWGIGLVVHTTGDEVDDPRDGPAIMFRNWEDKNWQIRGETKGSGFQITEDGGDEDRGERWGKPRLHISPGGNVGIGTTTTTQALTVNGYVAAKQVAFSAYVAKQKQGGKKDPLPMVTSQNIGGCYDTTESKFTAPVKGIYLFTMTGLTWGDSVGDGDKGFLNWDLKVKGDHANQGVPSVITEPEEPYRLTFYGDKTTASRTIILNLNKGDQVYVKQTGTGWCDNFRSGLEGVLLSATV